MQTTPSSYPHINVHNVTHSQNFMKKHSERRKQCTQAVVTRSQKISPRRRPASLGHTTAKI